MTFDELVQRLQTGDQQFDLFLTTYFIPCTRLDEIIVGNYSFKDVYSDFKYAIREFSITHTFVIEPCESPSWRTLFRKNRFTAKQFKSLVLKVNDILISYTDELLSKEKKRALLEKQILEYTGYYPEEADFKYSIFNKLHGDDDMDHLKYIYLDSVLTALQDAEVHQMQDNNYLAVTKLFHLKNEMQSALEYMNYLEKRKYLKTLTQEERVKTLKKYINQIRQNDSSEQEVLLEIRWFLFYLIYGKQKADIFMIHSILGYKYDGAVKLYQKLFLKDHTTGKANDFLHHTDILHLDYYHIDNENYYLFETIAHYLD